MTIEAVLGSKGREVVTLASDRSVREAAALLAERNIGALPVIDGGRVVGILSERDVVRCLAEHGGAILESSVAKLMTASVITVDPDMPVLAALSLITRRRVRHLPVIAGGELAGIVSIGDLVKYRMARIEAEAEAMRTYIQSA